MKIIAEPTKEGDLLYLMIHPESGLAYLQNTPHMAELEMCIGEFEWHEAPKSQMEFEEVAAKLGLHKPEEFDFAVQGILFDCPVRYFERMDLQML